MELLGSLISDDWNTTNEFSTRFGIALGKMGATASESWFTVYFKSGRDKSVASQQADIVLLETHISGSQHNLVLELTELEAKGLREKCEHVNRLREQLDEAQSLSDFATGSVSQYIADNA